MQHWIEQYQSLADDSARLAFSQAMMAHCTRILHATGSGYILLDAQLNLLEHNHHIEQWLPEPLQLGKQVSVLTDSLFPPWLKEPSNRLKKAAELQECSPSRLFIENPKQPCWLDVSVLLVALVDTTEILLIIENVSAQKQQQADALTQQKLLQTLHNRDYLTGLYNRQFMMTELERFHEQAKRDGRFFSIALIDVDAFKSINDTYGHRLADKVLLQMVKLLRLSLRSNDIYGRFGGEEFVVVLPDTHEEAATFTLNRLRSRLTETSLPGIKKRLTCTAGVVEWQAGLSLEQLLFFATERLEVGQAAGGNQVCGRAFF